MDMPKNLRMTGAVAASDAARALSDPAATAEDEVKATSRLLRTDGSPWGESPLSTVFPVAGMLIDTVIQNADAIHVLDDLYQGELGLTPMLSPKGNWTGGRSPTKLTADRPRKERQIAHETIGRLPIPWRWLR
jgi:hypothetical protein